MSKKISLRTITPTLKLGLAAVGGCVRRTLAVLPPFAVWTAMAVSPATLRAALIRRAWLSIYNLKNKITMAKAIV